MKREMMRQGVACMGNTCHGQVITTLASYSETPKLYLVLGTGYHDQGALWLPLFVKAGAITSLIYNLMIHILCN
jgi:hypothetical protein